MVSYSGEHIRRGVIYTDGTWLGYVSVHCGAADCDCSIHCSRYYWLLYLPGRVKEKSTHLVHFFTILIRDITFVTVFFPGCQSPLKKSPSEKGVSVKEPNLLPRGANSFLLEKTSFQKGNKYCFDIVVHPPPPPTPRSLKVYPCPSVFFFYQTTHMTLRHLQKLRSNSKSETNYEIYSNMYMDACMMPL